MDLWGGRPYICPPIVGTKMETNKPKEKIFTRRKETTTQRKRRLEKERRKRQEKKARLDAIEEEKEKNRRNLYMRQYRATETLEKRTSRLDALRKYQSEKRASEKDQALRLQALRELQRTEVPVFEKKDFFTFCDKVCEICTERYFQHQVTRWTVNRKNAPYLPDELLRKSVLLLCSRCKTYVNSKKNVPPPEAFWNNLHPAEDSTSRRNREEEDEEQKKFPVDEVLDSRIRNCQSECFLKCEDKWEPEENLDCSDIKQNYESSINIKQEHKIRSPDNQLREFDRSLDPDCNISANDASDELLLLMKCEDKTWESEENHNCPDLIQAYESSKKKKKEERKKLISDQSNTKRISKNIKEDNRLRGFDRNLDPDCIIGATDASGELLFLMKWKGSDEADLVTAQQANKLCPRVVINFYEKRLTSFTSQEDESAESLSLA